MAARHSANLVLTALASSGVIAATAFTAAAWSGSSAMLAVAIQALIGAASQALLLYALKRPAALRTPHAATNELYFWSFGVAVLLFSLGAGIAIYDGVLKLSDPLPNKYDRISYATLAAAAVLLVVTSRIALLRLSAAAPRATEAAGPARTRHEPAASTIVIEGLAGLLGVAIAAGGLAISQSLSAPSADGYAAIAIGLVLGVVSAFMALEIRTLLIGGAYRSGTASQSFFIETESPADARLPRAAAAGSATAASPAPLPPKSPPAAPRAPAEPSRTLSRKERKRLKRKH